VSKRASNNPSARTTDAESYEEVIGRIEKYLNPAPK